MHQNEAEKEAKQKGGKKGQPMISFGLYIYQAKRFFLSKVGVEN